MMFELISDFEAIVRAMSPTDDVLFGVQLETETVAAPVNDVAVACGMTGMYSLRPGLASFRIVFTAEVELLRSAMIDVAVNYSILDGLSFDRDVFFKFANAVAAPHARSYAQTILDGLLLQMKLPGRLLPPVGAFEEGPFRAGSSPEVLTPVG